MTRIDKFFDREINANRVPGAVVAIARDGKLVYFKAFGSIDKPKDTPMPLDAVFALASMTKIMTSVAALQLNQEGRLPLKSLPSDYYPEFSNIYGFGLGVAVRTEPGMAAVSGNVGEYSWNGAYGTVFFADPKAKLVVVVGTAASGEIRKYDREQVQSLLYGAMTR